MAGISERQMGKALSILLALSLCMAFVPSYANAADGSAASIAADERVEPQSFQEADRESCAPETETPETTRVDEGSSSQEGEKGISEAASDDDDSADEVQQGLQSLSVPAAQDGDVFSDDAVSGSEAASSTEFGAEESEARPTPGFLYVDEGSPEEGATQRVVFALSDEQLSLTAASLFYSGPGGEGHVEAAAIEGSACLFEIEHLAVGNYRLVSVEFSVSGRSEVFLEELEGDACFFEVEGGAPNDAVEISALALNDQGDLAEAVVTKGAIEESLEEPALSRSATLGASSTRSLSARAASSPEVVVALDPGHGGSDGGASANGLVEKNLTLSIAKYCQAALQRQGITVFMTRSTDVAVGLSERVRLAANAGASVFVSIHINSASVTANGCEVWVPNGSSYNHDAHVAGEALGERIVEKLASLGLNNRGVKVRDSENGSKYPDGSVADYYSVINGARSRGIPGIIVEHAFISNKGDAMKLSSEAFLKSLGEADAQGIIEAIRSGEIKGQGGLYNDGKGTRYKTAAGVDLKNDWVSVGGKRYYMGSDGYAVLWENKIDGYWYYFNGSGVMQTGWVTWSKLGTKSYFDADGRARTGWQAIGGKRYYFDPATARSLRWENRIGGSWYYFNAASEMQTGWVTWSKLGTKSYFNDDGKARTGWHTLWGKRYYFDPATARSLRWENRIGGSWYYFNAASEMQTGWLTWSNDRSKSYFDPANGGAMVIGQATIDGMLYDFGTDGKIRNMIMGSPRTTVDAMVRDFKSQGKSYLSQVYTAKGAPTIESFCKILYEEATAEGVRPAVLYAQVMLETGWLQFKGSSVKPEQCNFGGVGATDKDPKPATFADVRTGLRAQVQHLKAYGSTEALKNPCVDPRFHLVKRGVAPYVADLAGRWASDKEYGIKLNKLIDRVAS